MFVMLKRNWPGPFRRSVRDEDGNVVRLLTFAPGEAVKLQGEDEIDAVAADIGNALIEVGLDGRLRPKSPEQIAAATAADSGRTADATRGPKSSGKKPPKSSGKKPPKAEIDGDPPAELVTE